MRSQSCFRPTIFFVLHVHESFNYLLISPHTLNNNNTSLFNRFKFFFQNFLSHSLSLSLFLLFLSHSLHTNPPPIHRHPPTHHSSSTLVPINTSIPVPHTPLHSYQRSSPTHTCFAHAPNLYTRTTTHHPPLTLPPSLSHVIFQTLLYSFLFLVNHALVTLCLFPPCPISVLLCPLLPPLPIPTSLHPPPTAAYLTHSLLSPYSRFRPSVRPYIFFVILFCWGVPFFRYITATLSSTLVLFHRLLFISESAFSSLFPRSISFKTSS